MRARPTEVAKIAIPVPPLSEQRRIAAILDKADTLRQKRREAIAKLDQLLQSVFLKMFGGPVTNPRDWPSESLDAVSEQLKRGPFGGALKKEMFVREGYKVYEQQHAISGDFSLGTYYIDDAKFRAMKSFADVVNKQLVINEREAALVRYIFQRYLALGCVRRLKAELDDAGYVGKTRTREGTRQAGKAFSRGALYKILSNPLYVGQVAHGGKRYAGTHEAIIDQTLWEHVQEQLTENRSHRGMRTKAKDPGLLTGLLFDDRGNPMSPTHTRKGQRKYRYYVSQAVLQYRARDAGSVERIPAQTVEDLVIEQMTALLRDPSALHEAMGVPDLTASQRQTAIEDARALADGWNSSPTKDQLKGLEALISRIELGRKQLTVRFSPVGLRQTFLPDSVPVPNDAIPPYTVTIGVNLTRCKHEMRLLPAGEHRIPPPGNAQKALQNAVAQAFAWNEALVEGRVASMSALAKREGVTQRYVARMLRLAYLSPDLVAAIVQGDIPPTLTLERIKKGFSLDWQSQSRELLSLDPR